MRPLKFIENTLKGIGVIFLYSFLPNYVLSNEISITNLGHSSLLFQGENKTVLINPFKAVGCASHLKEPNIKADLILASSVLLDEGFNKSDQPMFVYPGSYVFKKFTFEGIPVAHDRIQGRRFGMATVWTWNQAGFKVVHMGGAAGSISQYDRILLANPDILIISVGGGAKSYNGLEASDIVKKLNPKVIVPVQYSSKKNINTECDLEPIDQFLNTLDEVKISEVNKKLLLKKKSMNEKTIFVFR
tara:strand:- start:28716 stop:29450 length:735 start_codon:yes stop_codon:yes gene_type:complete